MLLAQAVNDSKFSIPQINEDLIQELDIIVQINIDKDNRPIEIISKEKMKDIIGRSPDEADSVMMRMYFDLVDDHIDYSLLFRA